MIINKLRALGLKLTPQRMDILKLLEGNTTHPSAEAIYNQLKPRYPSLSLSTVYNTLELLLRAGELQEIRISRDKRHFDPNPAPHGHFLCRICGNIFDLETSTLDVKGTFEAGGHLVEDYSLYYYGVCHSCRNGDG